MQTRIVVIGINHAGTSAIRTLLAQNPHSDIVAFDRNDNISFLGCGIALSVSGVVRDVYDLFYADCAALQSIGANVRMNHNVTAIDTAAKIVTARDQATGQDVRVPYDKLIYAAGSWPIEFAVKNRELENIQVCKLFQHARDLIARAGDPTIKSVAVIGAGYIGIELAEAYHNRGKQVTLVDLQSRVVPRYFDPEFTQRLETDIRAHGIGLLLGAKVTAYEGTPDGKVAAVVTTQGKCPADLVIECTGFRPNSGLLPGVRKTANGAILVNERMQTSDPDIYAIGDAAAIYNAASRRHEQIALATNAVKGGVVAASQINGLGAVTLKSAAGTNAICVFGNKLASTGLSEQAARDLGLKVSTSYYVDSDRPEFMNAFEEIHVKLVYETESLRLVGAQIGSYGAGNHTECIYYLAQGIQQGLTLLDLAMTDVYFLPHFNKPFNFILSAILQAIGLNYVKK